MGKFKLNFETIRFPLIILLITIFLRGLSNTLLNQQIANLLTGNLAWLIPASQIIKQFSSLIIQYLPFIVVTKILIKKYRGERIILMFFVSYLLLLTITMVIGDSSMPAVVYKDVFGIKNEVFLDLLNNKIIQQPYRLGLIGAIIAGMIADISFKITRTRTKYGFLPFIDKDVLGLLLTIIFTLFSGVLLAYIWPFLIQLLFKVFTWISNDITNPISTFVYGFFDRIFSILDLSNLNRETFWFTSLGGSWMSEAGESFVGDVSVWSQQLKQGIYNTGFGRFITPYYIINIFAIPGIVLGIYSNFTNNKQRRSYLSLAIFIILFSLIADISLPTEIFLLIMAPLLYFFHIFIVSSLFALLQGLDLFLGMTYSGPASGASLGSGVDLIFYFHNADLKPTIISLLIIGGFIILIYFFMTRLYYKYLSFALIDKLEIEVLVDELLEIVGGIDNIEVIDSSPFRIDVQLNRPQLFDYNKLESSSISRVIESRTSYALYYGTASTMLRKEIILRKELLN